MLYHFIKKCIIGCLLFQLLILIIIVSVNAEIVTDSSFGKAQSIPSENNTYHIDADLGKQSGQNLFHSFHTFTIEKGMTANFTGPSSIQRIISRVTGGEISQINGTIKSSIQGADVYLLNSSGIIFNESAQLDIDGSFFVSTADYIQMNASEKFMTGSTDTSGLVISAPKSFGFLDSNSSSIRFKGSEAIVQENYDETNDSFKDINTKFPLDNGLTVSDNNDFCIIGGQITIENGVRIGIKDHANQTDKGSIQFVSIKGQADVYLRDTLDYSKDAHFGNITIKDSILNTSGNTVGGIHIVGSDILVENSIFYLDNFGAQNALPIRLSGNKMTFSKGAKIISNTYSNGNAAPIYLTAQSDILFQEEYASIYSFSDKFDTGDEEISGNTSSMSISAKNLLLYDGSRILSRTHSSGNCSDISILADESIILSSKDKSPNECSIFFDTYGAGEAGTINLDAKLIEFSKGAKLSVSTQGTGKGGSIFINAQDFHMTGIRYDSITKPDQGTRIFVKSYGKMIDAGDAGDLQIHADNIIMSDGAQIKAQTYGFGKGPNVTIIATEDIVLKGMEGRGYPAMINASCDHLKMKSGENQSGNITIHAKNIQLKDGAWISTQTEGKGNAGTVDITAIQKLELSGECLNVEKLSKDKKPSCIVSSAMRKSKGDGGTITINANEILLLNGAYIETGTQSSGNAGEINIKANTITLMKTSTDHKSCMIESNTQAKKFDRNILITGNGGHVSINAKNLNMFDGARISSSSIADKTSSGEAGDILVNLEGTLQISGQNVNELNTANKLSGIYARSIQENMLHSGKAGKITITANKIMMNNHGLITTSSNGQSNAGDIDIQARQSIILNQSRIASESKMPESENQYGGQAGSIKIIAGENIKLLQSAHITTNAVSSGGGKIDIQNEKALTLFNSNITTNVREGSGNGGDINIHTKITVMNHSNISANADAGDGGAIYIYTRNLIQSTDSRIEATSERGNDGKVEIETPDIQESPNLLNLSDHFLNNISIVNTLCDQSNDQASIQLVVHSSYINNFSTTLYPSSADSSIRLLSANFSDQFDNFLSDFSDEALYQEKE